MSYIISPTRIRSYRRCPRRWWFECVAGHESPDTEATIRGTLVHSALETYLLTGNLPQEIDPEVWGVLAAGLEHLPQPPLPRRWVEVQIALELEGVTVRGQLDLAYPDPSRRWVNVVDHKSSTGNEDYVKSEHQLATDPQAVIYGSWASANAESLGLGPSGLPVRFSLDYYWTKGQRGHRRVTALLSPGVLQEELGYLGLTARNMLTSAEAIRAADVEGNPAACGDFGGCSHLPLCRQGRIIPQGVQAMSSTIEQLRAARAARKAKLADAPPPEEDAKPTTPPKRKKPQEAKAPEDPVERLKAKERAKGRAVPETPPETAPETPQTMVSYYGPGVAGSLEDLPVAGLVRVELDSEGAAGDAHSDLEAVCESYEQGVAQYSAAGQLSADQLQRSTRGFNSRAQQAGSPLRAVAFKLGEGAVIRYSLAVDPGPADVNPPDGPAPDQPSIPPAGPAEAPKAPPVPRLPDGSLVSKAPAKDVVAWFAELTDKDVEEVKAKLKELAGIESGRLTVDKPRELAARVALAESPSREACHLLGWPLPEDRGMTEEPAPSNEEPAQEQLTLQTAPAPQPTKFSAALGAQDRASKPVQEAAQALRSQESSVEWTLAEPGYFLFIDCQPQSWPYGEVIHLDALLSHYYERVAKAVGAAYYAAPEYREGQRRVMDEFIPDLKAKGLSGAILLDSRSPIYGEAVQVLVPGAIAVIRGF